MSAPVINALDTHEGRTANLMATCPAIKHLREILKKALDTGIEVIEIHDGEQWTPVGADKIEEAVQEVLEIDGVVTYRVGSYTFACLYDGPYDEENAPEILMDCNTAAGELLGMETY